MKQLSEEKRLRLNELEKLTYVMPGGQVIDICLNGVYKRT